MYYGRIDSGNIRSVGFDESLIQPVSLQQRNSAVNQFQLSKARGVYEPGEIDRFERSEQTQLRSGLDSIKNDLLADRKGLNSKVTLDFSDFSGGNNIF